jgi:peptidoglycan/LPS O-acetylase OafA/YrhL
MDLGVEARVDVAAPPDAPGSPDAPVMDEGPRKLGYVRGFDGFRGLAVIIVVIAHFNLIVPLGDEDSTLAVAGGTVSLESFFVMSGFLITVLLLKEQQSSGRIRFLAFYRRRALRLFPALAFVLAGHAFYAWTVDISARREFEWLFATAFYHLNWKLAFDGNVTFIGNFDAPAGLQHLWSLSLEEQFYLIWPAVVVLLLPMARSLKTVVAVCGGLILAVGAYRAWLYWDEGFVKWYPNFIRSDAHWDSFLWGALLAHLWARRKEPTGDWLPKVAWVTTALLLWALAEAKLGEPFLFYGGVTLIDLGCTILLLAILDGRWGATKLLQWRPLVGLGERSYALYLWHLPILMFIRDHTEDRWSDAVQVVVTVALCATFTTISWRYLEKPALAWKRKLEKRTPDAGARGNPADPVRSPAAP